MNRTIAWPLLILSLFAVCTAAVGGEEQQKVLTVAQPANADYEPFLLKKTDFGDVRELKQRVVRQRVLEGSLPRQRVACIQEAFMPNDEIRIVEYLLCESPLEACAVMFHHALTVAEPGHLLFAGPHTRELQVFGGTEAVDDVYLFVGSTAQDHASMMLRKDRLLVRVSILKDPSNAAQETRDSLARSVLRQAREAFRERASVTLEDVVYCPSGSPSQQPLMCLPGKDFPEGREMTFRDPESGEFVHAVFPKAVAAPENLEGSFVLHGRFQGIQNWDAFQPANSKELIKSPPRDYRYFVVSLWEHGE